MKKLVELVTSGNILKQKLGYIHKKKYDEVLEKLKNY